LSAKRKVELPQAPERSTDEVPVIRSVDPKRRSLKCQNRMA
jgi:hypothetical protein